VQIRLNKIIFCSNDSGQLRQGQAQSLSVIETILFLNANKNQPADARSNIQFEVSASLLRVREY
jgi:hypothetical protein